MAPGSTNIWGIKKASVSVLLSAEAPISFKGYRFPPDIISYAVWLYYRFPLSRRMVEEMLAARGIELMYETVRCWATKFGLAVAKRQVDNTARTYRGSLTDSTLLARCVRRQ